jgi:(1->4)-alpha-D-glucan 1-alpha-D-glucosylmutase
LLDSKHSFHNLEKEELIEFTMKFQQVTSPLMAKGIEDTMFYIYNRFISLNEVGSEPSRFGFYANGFHNFNIKRAEKWPNTLNALSTHDTKRGEDFRARLNVLSELPEEWEQNIKRWHKINRRLKPVYNGVRYPDKNDEYFLYQTLVGSFPFAGQEFGSYFGRLKEYLIKSVREAKVHTAWIKPDAEYEDSYIKFAEAILDFNKPNQFIEQFLPFVRKISHYGLFNSLAQVLLKITCPGIPDLYQGAELWDFSFVDPDNRRPVDFGMRKSYLDEIIGNSKRPDEEFLGFIKDLIDKKEDGRIKLFLTHQALKARKQNLEVFQKGSYVGLETGGRYKANVLAFARILGQKVIITVVPRFLTRVIGQDKYPLTNQVWEDTYIAFPYDCDADWKNMITGQGIAASKTLLVGQIFNDFPAGLIYNHQTRI